MGFLDRFRKKDEDTGLDPLRDFVLEKLKVGYLVDYELQTWTVTEEARYYFNDGRSSREWELTSGRQKLYLERSEEGWSLSKTIPIGALGSGEVRDHIVQHEDPPDQVRYDDKLYFLEGSVGGRFLPGEGEARELIAWELVDEAEESFVSIMQWSDTEFTAVHGIFVEEYQFTNILPGGAP